MAAAVVAVGAGCGKGADGPSGGRADKAPAVLPGVAEQARAVRDSTELIGRYDAAAAAHPTLAARLRPLRAEVARHIEAFGGTRPPARAGQDAATGDRRARPWPASPPPNAPWPTAGPPRS